MSETTENLSIAASGSGKSPEEVAFELLSKLKGQGVWGERNIDSILDMYAQCLDATKGLRAYEGQSRVDVPIQAAKAPAPAQKTAPQTPVAQIPKTETPKTEAPQVQSPVAQQTAQPQTAQPVHVQQQQIQQAYKPA